VDSNRNGQAITLKADWKGKVGADPKALKPFVEKAKALGEPLTFAMTFPPGTHAMWMRYYLGAGGVNPDKDVALITVPPAQMVANMKIGKMDGFCVGEPWNARSIADKIGFTSVTTQDIWKDHPEKVCAFTVEFADKNPKTIKAVLKGIARNERLAGRPEQSPGAMRHCQQAEFHQLPEGNHPRPLARQARLRRRSQRPGRVLHALQQEELQLPPSVPSRSVAYAIPPMGHGHRHARLRRRRQTGHAAATSTPRR